MWTYKQSTGELFSCDGTLIAKGWSGQGPGKNNPQMQHVKNTGPLPRGIYTIQKPAIRHFKLGPMSLILVPDTGNEMFGRSDFLIHGASAKDPENSSEGCIIMPRKVREMIAESDDDHLQVIE